MSAEFVDTNIMIYSMSEDANKRRKALAILARKPLASVQVLNETANIMRRKLAFDIPTIRQFLMDLQGQSRVHPLTSATVCAALAIAERYGFSYYDSLIVATALDAGCDTLYSEDMQHGQVIDGRVRIVNPFL